MLFVMCSTSNKTSSSQPGDEKMKPGVVSVHVLKLKPGIDADEFVSFANSTFLPIYNKINGIDAFIAKGDRGMLTNNFSLILTFESLKERNRHFTPSGKYSNEINMMLSQNAKVFEKMGEYLEEGPGVNHTDWVILEK
jgi:hypothetical protein